MKYSFHLEKFDNAVIHLGLSKEEAQLETSPPTMAVLHNETDALL